MDMYLEQFKSRPVLTHSAKNDFVVSQTSLKIKKRQTKCPQITSVPKGLLLIHF